MAAVNHVSQRADALPWLVLQPDRTHHFAIHRCDLFAGAQVGNGGHTMLLRDPESDAAAGPTSVEAEHEARLLRRAPMHERVDAERAMFADQARRDLLDEFESRPPHQRAITEHPQVAFGQFRFGDDFRWHGVHGLPEFYGA